MGNQEVGARNGYRHTDLIPFDGTGIIWAPLVGLRRNSTGESHVTQCGCRHLLPAFWSALAGRSQRWKRVSINAKQLETQVETTRVPRKPRESPTQESDATSKARHQMSSSPSWQHRWYTVLQDRVYRKPMKSTGIISKQLVMWLPAYLGKG